MNPRVVAIALAAALLLGWALLGGRGASTPTPSPAAMVPPAPPVVAVVAPPPPATAPVVSPTQPSAIAVPASLQGAQIDGAVGLDARGRLRIDADLLRFFDWHRSALGELDEAALRRWLSANLDARLPPAARDEALDLYALYLDYLREADQLAGLDPWQRNEALRALRLRLFGADRAEALFAQEQRWMDAQLARQAIRDDRRLDAAQRQAQLRELEASLPPLLSEDPLSGLAREVEQLNQQFDQAQLSAAERHAERRELLGEEAAQRLARLDAERADWQARMQQYLDQREALRRQAFASEAERQRALDGWAAARYDPAELRRIAALLGEGGG